MPDLADFLLERIAEDEFLAIAAALDEEQFGPLGNVAGTTADARLAHALRWNAARVRLEATVRRQLVQIHPAGGHHCPGAAPDDDPCPTLRLIGLTYADHPDYLPHWRP